MRHTLTLIALAGLASTTLAQTTVNTIATQTGTIQPAGPRQGVNGDRFFNVEGFNNGAFASYGVARWDLTASKAALDTAYGAGNWHITSVELELTQSNAAFSLAGPVSVYYSTDDTTDVKTLASPCFYPFFDPFTSAPDLTLGNGGASILQYGFTVVATNTLDRYTQTGSTQNGAPLSATEVLSLAPDMVTHITAGNLLTFVFVDGAISTAATYRGQEPFAPAVGPNLFITAVQNTVSCYANCDGSTSSPRLTANDFQCFLNEFAANHSYANCDGSTATPILTANDFQCFLNAYATGCP